MQSNAPKKKPLLEQITNVFLEEVKQSELFDEETIKELIKLANAGRLSSTKKVEALINQIPKEA